MAHDELVARSILVALGTQDAELSRVGVGLASDAWLIRDGDEPQVLRIATYPEDPVTYPSEHAIMAMLRRSGATVPEPIVGSWEIQGWPGPAFSVTSCLPGTVLQADALVWADEPIAAFLRILHRRLEGYGPVDEVDGRLRGRHEDAEVGAIAAWSGAPTWPLVGATLDRHPALMDLPDLARSMERHTAGPRGHPGRPGPAPSPRPGAGRGRPQRDVPGRGASTPLASRDTTRETRFARRMATSPAGPTCCRPGP